MPDTGAPWNIPFLDGTELVRAYPAASEDLADAVAAGLSAAGNAGIGSNVVQTVKTDVFTTTSSTLTDVTGLTVSITPTSATAKILVLAYVFSDFSTSIDLGLLTLTDGSNNNLIVPDSPGSRTGGFHRSQGQGQSLGATSTFVFLHEPETTSSFTYKIRARRNSGTLFVNRNDSEVDTAAFLRAVSTITAIEVAA